jgi:hypothetical protein
MTLKSTKEVDEIVSRPNSAQTFLFLYLTLAELYKLKTSLAKSKEQNHGYDHIVKCL